MGIATLACLAALFAWVALFLAGVATVFLEHYRESRRERKELEDTLKHMELLK
jgi:hypothetical protein